MMLAIIFIKGLVIGLVLALPAGPVGLLCVRRTLFEGVSFGLVSGVGAAIADTIFCIIAAFGLTFISDWILLYQNWLGVAGGVFLIAIGVRALLLRDIPEPEPLDGEKIVGVFASAFALTISNPITILAFAAIFAKFGVGADAAMVHLAVVVAGVFVGSALWWLGLTFGIAWVKRRARRVTLGWVHHASGAILTLSGIGLVGTAGLALAGHRL